MRGGTWKQRACTSKQWSDKTSRIVLAFKAKTDFQNRILSQCCEQCLVRALSAQSQNRTLGQKQ